MMDKITSGLPISRWSTQTYSKHKIKLDTTIQLSANKPGILLELQLSSKLQSSKGNDSFGEWTLWQHIPSMLFLSPHQILPSLNFAPKSLRIGMCQPEQIPDATDKSSLSGDLMSASPSAEFYINLLRVLKRSLFDPH